MSHPVPSACEFYSGKQVNLDLIANRDRQFAIATTSPDSHSVHVKELGN